MWNARLILNVIVPILSVMSDGAIPISPQETASSAMMGPPNFHRTTRAGRLRWRIARRERLCAALIHGYRPYSSRSRRTAAEVGSNITIIINGVLLRSAEGAGAAIRRLPELSQGRNASSSP
jgi:hypothetical protein